VEDLSVQQFLVFLIVGVSFGSAYALLALSINVIYASSNVLNFAQGELMMIGGMLSWALNVQLGVPYYLMVLLTVVVTAALCGASYFAIVMPLLRRKASIISIVIGTLGFSIVLRIVAQLIFGKEGRSVHAPFGTTPLTIAGASIVPQTLVIIAVVAAVVVVLWWTYTRTTVGLVLRAVAYEPSGSKLVGINVSTVTATSFILGGALAGLSGLLIAPLSYASPFVGLDYAIAGFAGAVIGGLGSWPGAVLGGLTVGLSQIFLAGYVSPDWASMGTFGLIILVLLLKPSGLFAERQASSA
jgi:branched-chain amino acid transport system permease protein